MGPFLNLHTHIRVKITEVAPPPPPRGEVISCFYSLSKNELSSGHKK